jgi:hypothetical protein
MSESSNQAIRARGGCLCGGVRYEVHGPLRGVIACHCSQCRRTSGHFVAASEARTADLALLESATLRWYRSSVAAERGFCSRCGGNLFWRPTGAELGVTSIMAGTLDSHGRRPTVAAVGLSQLQGAGTRRHT